MAIHRVKKEERNQWKVILSAAKSLLCFTLLVLYLRVPYHTTGRGAKISAKVCREKVGLNPWLDKKSLQMEKVMNRLSLKKRSQFSKYNARLFSDPQIPKFNPGAC